MAAQDTVKSHTITIGNSELGSFHENLFPKKAPSRWSVGLQLGMADNHYDVDVQYADKVQFKDAKGLTIGLQGRGHLTGWLAARADLMLVQKNYIRSHTAKPSGNTVVQVRNAIRNNYISLPLMAEVSIGNRLRMYLNGGGYVGFWLSSRCEGESLSMDFLLYDENEGARFDERYTFDKRRDNRFDAGWVYGAGVAGTIGDKITLNAEWRQYYALTDTQKQYMLFQMPRYHTTNVLQIGAAYHF